MRISTPARTPELPPHHQPIPRILTIITAVALATALSVAGALPGARAAENTAPIAVAESYTATTGVMLSVPAPGLLANDTDAESGVTMGTYIGANWGATTVDYATGAFTYISPAGFVGDDYIHYQVIDAQGLESTQVSAKITVTLAAGGGEPIPVLNSAPVALDDAYSVNPGGTLTVLADAGVLSDDTDADGDPLTAVAKSAPSIGSGFSLGADGGFTWTAPSDFCGEITFTYAAADAESESNTAAVQILATGEKDFLSCPDDDEGAGGPADGPGPPALPAPTLTATDDLFFAAPGQSIVVEASWGLLSNDVHSAGGGFEVVSHSEPTNGAFSLLADGSFVWTAPENFCDVLTFTYTAGNGVLMSNLATVTLYASISGGDVECETPAEAPSDDPADDQTLPTIPTLPLPTDPTDPGTPTDEPELSGGTATPGRDTLAYTGADDFWQGIGWGALLAVLLGLGLVAPRRRRGETA